MSVGTKKAANPVKNENRQAVVAVALTSPPGV